MRPSSPTTGEERTEAFSSADHACSNSAGAARPPGRASEFAESWWMEGQSPASVKVPVGFCVGCVGCVGCAAAMSAPSEADNGAMRHAQRNRTRKASLAPHAT